eukprot:1134317-Pelagomonas_calceolata.AAC.2
MSTQIAKSRDPAQGCTLKFPAAEKTHSSAIAPPILRWETLWDALHTEEHQTLAPYPSPCNVGHRTLSNR